MPVVIPFAPSVPHQEFESGRYRIAAHWNERWSAWVMDLMTLEGRPVRMGIRICLGVPLGRRCTSPDFPPGFIIAVDTTGKGVEPTLDDLGTRVLVLFYSGPEILRLAGAVPGEASAE